MLQPNPCPHCVTTPLVKHYPAHGAQVTCYCHAAGPIRPTRDAAIRAWNALTAASRLRHACQSDARALERIAVIAREALGRERDELDTLGLILDISGVSYCRHILAETEASE